MPSRQKLSSWASIAVLALMLAADGTRAFSSPPTVSSRTSGIRNPPPAAGISGIGATGAGGLGRRGSSLRALPRPPAALARAPPVPAFAPAFVGTAVVAASALAETVLGGAFAGSLHAIAGPDHLAALIPRCCGLPWYRAARVGAVWGLGHGVSATMLGMAGFLFKKGVRLSGVLGDMGNFDLLHHAGSFMELAIGFSLIVIGLLGIKEAREWEAPKDGCELLNDDGSVGVAKSLGSAATPERLAVNANPRKRAVLFNGFLHGFSWDGAPSLAPAVAIASWRGSLTFLLSYALGTMAAMTMATTIIGEGTRRAAGKLDRPDLPRDLSMWTSALALAVGVLWCGLALR